MDRRGHRQKGARQYASGTGIIPAEEWFRGDDEDSWERSQRFAALAQRQPDDAINSPLRALLCATG
jgi:hypothetical protein